MPTRSSDAEGAPLAGFTDAFKGCDQLVLYDRIGSDWHAHAFDVPRNTWSRATPRSFQRSGDGERLRLGAPPLRTLDAERPI